MVNTGVTMWPMSKIISFAWTTPALLAGRKTCTRRDWSQKYAGGFASGELVQAWDKNPRSRVGQQVAWIRLTAAPYQELMQLMPDSDYEAEGYRFFEEHPEELPQIHGPMGVTWVHFENWRNSPDRMWVVRFELEEVLV